MTKTSLRFGIRFKLILIICAMGLLPLTFLGYQAYNEQRRVLMEEISRGHKELSNMLSHGIFENLEHTRQLLNAIVELDVIKQLNPVVAQDFFKSLLRHYPIFKLLYLVDGNRQIIASTDPGAALPEDWLFSHAVKRSYQGALSEVAQTSEGNPYMTLETVIKSPEKGVIGVLVSEVDLLYIRTLLINALKRSKSQGLVLDETGTVIARSSPEVKTFTVSAAEVIDQDINDVRDVSGTRYLVTAVSLKKFNFYQAPNWTIILQIPEKVAFQAADELKQRVQTLGALTGIVALILAFLLANHLVGPLINLITGARFISRGAFDHEIHATSKDEIGELARTFNEMRVNLKMTKADLDYRIIQLSTLYEVGKAINSELDFVKLQNMILETVARVLRAEKASLMLLDETEKILTIGTAFGLSEEVAKSTRLEVGEAVAGWVLESGKALFVQDVESDHAFLALKKSNVSRGTLMSVPLRAKDKILGVLNVSRSEPNS
ncbi:MAG TPA: GAF domain-containing protein, partial [Candidatus Ozemobacteraceae bacterium]|nr:GAF domain-containing protein [Candidatus Ozemobacteraceae bacterium]